jgi:hypothetical protein
VVARARDATEPEALTALRDNLGADVSVAIGKHAQGFHPKLWLFDHADRTVVMSGSGNLTDGGLRTNSEQFEMLTFEAGDPAIAAHHERFDLLTEHADALDAVEGTAAWRSWLQLRKEQGRARKTYAHIERRYDAQESLPERPREKQQLIDDLQAIYDDTVAADIPNADGKQYYPYRLLGSVKACRAGERNPVKVASNMVRSHTEGFDVLFRAGMVDLTVEWLVANPMRVYHGLFSTAIVQTAERRIEEFREAGHPVPEVDAPRPPAVVSVMSNQEITDHLQTLLDRGPGDYQLPKLHRAQAALVRVNAGQVVVRRDSGTETDPIPVRLVRLRLNEMASAGRRFLVSELKEKPSDRFTSALGPLLAALPNVKFDADEKRLYYD